MKPRFESDWRRTKEEGVKVKTNHTRHTRVRMSHIRTHAKLTDARITTHTQIVGTRVEPKHWCACQHLSVKSVRHAQCIARDRITSLLHVFTHASMRHPVVLHAGLTGERERKKKSAADDEQKPPSR